MASNATEPISLPGDEPPSRGRRLLINALVLLLGLAGGFAISEFTRASDDEALPDADLVFYESSSVAFPIEGARFTDSTFDPNEEECDRELLKRLLRADPRRFEAWLDLQEIDESQFDAFVDRLETRILDRPTPVTNHGCFPEGEGECPFAIQSVLGPGTPVWIDPDQGDRIVAKCACSNPIREPKCPPNCEDDPTPTPSPSPSPTATPIRTVTPPPTLQPTPTPVEQTPSPSPSRPPTPSPVPTITLQPPA